MHAEQGQPRSAQLRVWSRIELAGAIRRRWAAEPVLREPMAIRARLYAMKLKLQAQHSIPAALLLVSGVFMYLAKLPVEPTTVAGWGAAVLSAILWAFQQSVISNAPAASKLTSSPPNSVAAAGAAGSESALPAAPAAGAAGPTGPAGV